MQVFFDDGDRRSYLRKIESKCRKYRVEVLCWCLMPNHVHLIMKPGEESGLSLAVGRAHWAYVKELNEKHGCSGRLFQGRFYSTPMDEWHAMNAVRYVLRNPVRAGMVREPGAYEWSSARFLLGMEMMDPLVTDREVLAVHDWQEFLDRETSDIEDLRSCTLKGRPYGDDSFVSWVEDRTGVDLSAPKRGRPKKSLRADCQST